MLLLYITIFSDSITIVLATIIAISTIRFFDQENNSEARGAEDN